MVTTEGYRGNNTPPYKVHSKHQAVSKAKQRVQNQVPENQSLNISLNILFGIQSFLLFS